MEASFRIMNGDIEVRQMCMTGSIKENIVRFQVTAISVRWLMNVMWRIDLLPMYYALSMEVFQSTRQFCDPELDDVFRNAALALQVD